MKEIIIDKNFGSIMIVVPHEDDELLISAGIIKQAVLSNQEVTVVMATNGDYGCKDYSVGRARLNETLEGLKLLGLSEKNVIFLGYADTGMPEEESFLSKLYSKEDENEIVESHCSTNTYGLIEKDDFHTEYFGNHAMYTRKSFCEDLKIVIEKYKPMNIFTTSDYDVHGDHKALYLFVLEILGQLRKENGYTPSLYGGIVHSCAGDENWPVCEDDINVFSYPNCLEEKTNYKWNDRISFPVLESMKEKDRSINLKYQAISRHVTALKPDAIDYLFSFVKADEIFWKINW